MTIGAAAGMLWGQGLPARAVEVIPLYRISLTGGQYFFASDKSNLNANIKATAAPAVKLDEEWTLLPLYNGNFRGTKSVNDTVGSGTLFQQGMDHYLSFAGLYKPEDSTWRFKPAVNYKLEFLKETRDETWGKGLFDYQTVGVELAAENVYKEPFSYRLGYEFFYTFYPNYQSLESQAGIDPNGNRLNRENAGTDVLDTINNALNASISIPVPYDEPKVALNLGYRAAWQRYPDQPIIAQDGEPNDHKPYNRQDFYNSLTVGVTYPRSLMADALRMNLGFHTGVSHNGSNQNTYDAGKTRFISDSYGYYSVPVGVALGLAWGDKKNPSTADLGCTWIRQQYLGRLAQDENGTYLDGERQRQDRFVLGLGYGYPIAPNFRLTAQASVARATSNTKFEQSYRYTYTAATYLLGFTYDY